MAGGALWVLPNFFEKLGKGGTALSSRVFPFVHQEHDAFYLRRTKPIEDLFDGVISGAGIGPDVHLFLTAASKGICNRGRQFPYPDLIILNVDAAIFHDAYYDGIFSTCPTKRAWVVHPW